MMRITKGGLYFLSKQLEYKFSEITDQVLYDKDMDADSDHRRPHILLHTDSLGIHWFVPVTSNLVRARTFFEQQVKKTGNCLTMHIGEIRGMRMGFMLNKLIPAVRRYVDKEYLWGPVQLVADQGTLECIEHKFHRLLEHHCTRCVDNERNYTMRMYNVMLSELQQAQ